MVSKYCMVPKLSFWIKRCLGKNVLKFSFLNERNTDVFDLFRLMTFDGNFSIRQRTKEGKLVGGIKA